MKNTKRILLLARREDAAGWKSRLERLGHAVLESSPSPAGDYDAALLEILSADGTPSMAAVPGACGLLPASCPDEVLEAALEAAGSARDAARLLRRGGEGIRSLFALSGEAVILADAEGRIQMFSSAAEQLFGHASAAVQGSPIYLLLDGGARQRLADAFAALLGGGPSGSLPLDARRADGSLFQAVLSLNVLAVEEGLRVAVLVRPAASDPFRTEVRKIAHDINNTLAAILGYSELARDSLEDRTALEEFTAELLKASGKAQDLVAQLMRIARKVP